MSRFNIRKRVGQRFEKAVYSVMSKFSIGYGQETPGIGGGQEPDPPYEREINPEWIYEMRNDQSLINNSIEEKVNQTFRRGLTDWKRDYVAKCPNCNEEFDTIQPFRKQLGDEGYTLDEEDMDFDTKRPCPSCEEVVDFHRPDESEKRDMDKFFQKANERDRADMFLEGEDQSSVSQTFLEVCKEVGWDVESFDDGWMIFERDYYISEDGSVTGWKFRGVHRGPPELMRYSADDEGNMGEEKWVCLKCRAVEDEYSPQDTGERCENCSNKTYRAYAKMLDQPNGRAVEWYVRGEFAHSSEYEPSKFYGYSPILSVWEEARTIEQMDAWYKEAYEERKTPRGALVIRSSNAESVRSFNREQMEKLRADPQHIPTFIDDTEGKGDPLMWQPLLEEPAQMQHMQMREWFLDRISAKFGVTSIFQSASPDNSGLSQSMEIIVSNRSAQRLKAVFDDVFIPAFIDNLQVDGWYREIAEVEEEDEVAEAERMGRELQNAQVAQQVGADVEWTNQDTIDVKPGELEPPEQEGPGGGEGGGPMGGMMGGGPGGGEGPGGGPGGGGPGPSNLLEQGGGPPGDGPSGPSGPMGGRPQEPNQAGGEPRSRNKPTGDNPIQAADNTMTTDTEGTSNATHGGGRGEEFDIFGHIESMLEEEKNKEVRKGWKHQARLQYDDRYGALGLEAETIEDYAGDDERTFSDLVEDNYGRWFKMPESKDAAKRLYRIFGGDQ